MTELEAWVEELVSGRKLSPATAKVLSVLTQDPAGTFALSAQKISERAQVNVASVVRASQFLGFSGWPDFKQELRHRYLATLSSEQLLTVHEPSEASPAAASLDADVKNLLAFAASADHGQIQRIAGMLHQSRRTVVLASGSYAAPGLQLAHVAQSIGYDVELHTAMSTALGHRLKMLREGDCVWCCSLWRSTSWILHATRVARERGARVIVVADRRTALSDMADESIIAPSEGASFVTSITAAMSVTQAVLTELAAVDPENTVRQLRETETLWRDLKLVDPQ